MAKKAEVIAICEARFKNGTVIGSCTYDKGAQQEAVLNAENRGEIEILDESLDKECFKWGEHDQPLPEGAMCGAVYTAIIQYLSSSK